MPRRVLTLAHLAAVACVAVLGADVVGGMLGRQLVGSLPGPASTAEGRAALGPARELKAFAPIVERNLFYSAGAGRLEEIRPGSAGQQSAAPPPPPRVPLQLLGTVVGEGEESFAIVHDESTNQQAIVRLHQRLAGQLVVARILRNKLILRGNGRTETLEVRYDRPQGAAAGPKAPAAPPARGGGIRPVGESAFLVDQREVTHAVENLQQLMTQARLVPAFTAGKPDGYRIFAIQPGSLYQRIGLQEGDIIKRINTVDVSSPEKAFQVLSELKDEKVVTVDLVRGDQPRTLRYEVR